MLWAGRYGVRMGCGLDGKGFEFIVGWTVRGSNVLWARRYGVRMYCGLGGTGFECVVGWTVRSSNSLWAGRYGVRISSETRDYFLPRPNFRRNEYRLVGRYSGWCVRLYTYLLLVRRLRMSADIPPLPLHSFKVRTRTVLFLPV
jgi:hypothetical protein